MVLLKCRNKKCGHEWNYKGKRDFYTVCPHCRFNVNLNKCKVKNEQ